MTVWKLIYNAYNTTFENAYVEQVVKINLGSIHNISLLGSNPNYIIITTHNGMNKLLVLVGSISLFNLVT